MDKRKSVTRATFDTSSNAEASPKRAVRVGGFAILAGATIVLAFFGLAPSAVVLLMTRQAPRLISRIVWCVMARTGPARQPERA